MCREKCAQRESVYGETRSSSSLYSESDEKRTLPLSKAKVCAGGRPIEIKQRVCLSSFGEFSSETKPPRKQGRDKVESIVLSRTAAAAAAGEGHIVD